MNANLRTTACDPQRLESFLSGALSDAQEREFTLHLNACEDCRRALEQQAAEPEAWREAEELLRPSEFVVTDAASVGTDAGSIRHEQNALQIQNVLDALRPTDDPAMLGRLGGYEVSGVVGAGGMGVVLKAIDRSLDRTVAIKVLAPYLASSGAARKRFAREAKAAAAVLHPNVIAIHSVSNDEALPYLVMPYVRGTSLQRRLDREGALPLQEILRIGAQIAAGLAAAHAQGLVHRDIKPANILLEEGVERVTITDFGLARAVDDATITHSGMIAGTPQYMSPEQARGEAVDPRSDLFSLGSVLYAICTGRPPFRAETSYGVMRRITDDESTAIRELNPDIPQWLCQIVSKLMSKRADDRYESAAEVAELLEACLAHAQQPTVAKLPPSLQPPAKGGRFVSMSRLWSGVIAMIAALGLGLLGVFAWQATEAPDIAGKWSGPEWGDVVLSQTKRGEYEGTYTDTFKKQPGTIEVKWSRLEGRYKGTWREGKERSGKISLRLVDNEIRGAWTTSKKSGINPGTPELADLAWTRSKSPAASAKKSTFGPVLEREVRNREAIDFDTGRLAMIPDADLNPKKGLIWLFEQRLDSITGWMAEQKMDALSDTTALIAFGLKVNVLTNADWETMDPEKLAAALQVDWEKVEPRTFGKAIHTIDPKAPPHAILAPRTVPRTIAFQTREGGMGIMQLMGGTKAGLKVRFKLLQVETEASQPPQPNELVEVKLRLNFNRTPWKDVLQWLAKEADLSLVADSFPSGTCNYSDTWAYTVPQAIEVLNGMLRTRGFILSHKDRTLVVWNLEDGEPESAESSSKGSLAAAAKQFNADTAQVRKELFTPPIPDLTVERLREGFRQTADFYRRQGNRQVADALQKIADSGHLPKEASALIATGVHAQAKGGGTYSRQVVPGLTLPDENAAGRLQLIVLRPLELIYRKDGPVSKDYGDQFDLEQGKVANQRPALQGTITDVLDLEFVELSLGANDGLQQGDTLKVFRDKTYLGKLTIRRTMAERSVARIESRTGELRRGDLVTRATVAEASVAPTTQIQVRFAAPQGMMVAIADEHDRFDELSRLKVPARLKLTSGKTYRLKLSQIPGRPGLELYPTIEVSADNPKTAEFLRTGAIPLEFTAEDFDEAIKGEAQVIKVIYLDENNKSGEKRVSEGDASSAPGAVLCIVRLGNIDLEGDKEAKSVTPEKVKAEFLRQAGDSAAAIKLYDRIAADKHLLGVLTESLQFPERRGILYAAELWRVWREVASPKAKEGGVPATDAAVCFYLGCDPASADSLSTYPVPPDATEGFRAHETMILSMAVRMELFAEERKEPFDRLIAGWTAARADPFTRELAIETAREYRLKAMVPVVRQIAADNKIEARFRAPAITLLAELGGQAERPLLQQLLEHGSECHRRKLTIKGEDAPTAIAQIRDVALGCLLLLDGADMRAAGFDELNYLSREPLKPHEYFRGAPFGFFSAEKRNEIHAKFAALRLSQDPPDDPTKVPAGPPASPKRLRQFPIKHRVGAIACSPDGNLIAIANSDVTFPLTADWKPVVEILDAQDGKTVATLSLATDEEHKALTTTAGLPDFEVGPLVFSPDGAVLAISTGLGQVKLFNARSGELIRSLDDEKARLADKATPEKLKALPRAMGRIASLAFSPDGSLLAACGESFADVASHWDRIERGGLGRRSTGPGRLKVWDVKSGALKHELAGHSHAFGVAFSPDGPWLASAGRWSAATNDGNGNGNGNGVLLWDLEKGAVHRTILIEANGATHAIVFSPKKKLAAIGSIIFDKENDTRSTALRVAYPLSGITQWQQTIPGAAMPKGFLPDGKSIVVLSGRNSVRLIDAESGQSKHEIKAAEGSLWIDVALAPKSGILVIAGAAEDPRGSVEIWDVGASAPGE